MYARMCLCLIVALTSLGCQEDAPYHASRYHSSYGSQSQEGSPVPSPAGGVVDPQLPHAVDAGRIQLPCPRPGIFGIPISCCPSGVCQHGGVATNMISTGFEMELGAHATLRYVVSEVDYNQNSDHAPFRSVVVRAVRQEVRMTRDTSSRFRNRIAVLIRPISAPRFIYVTTIAQTETCAEVRAQRSPPPPGVTDPWICIDLTRGLQVRRLTEEQTHRAVLSSPIGVTM